MNTLERLTQNKGTVSSALGKTMAEEVLGGREDILGECIALSSYEASAPAQKHVRAGAAKVVEIVAEKRPDLVAPRLRELLPALAVAEPQTRWMTIRTMGFCAALNPAVAREALECASRIIARKEGLCIASSADLYLGDLGALSRDDAARVFPLLESSMASAVENEQDWLLEALIKVYPNLGAAEQGAAARYAERWRDSSRKTTQRRVRRLLALREAKK